MNPQGAEELSKLVAYMAQGFVPRFEGSPYLATDNAGAPDGVMFICIPVALESIPPSEQ